MHRNSDPLLDLRSVRNQWLALLAKVISQISKMEFKTAFSGSYQSLKDLSKFHVHSQLKQ